MKNNKVIPSIIFSLAGLILILGIIQLVLYLNPQFEVINSGREQGATEQQISDYIRQQVMPQVMYYIIVSLGFVSTLVAAGMVFLGLARPKNSLDESFLDYNDQEAEDNGLNEVDDLFEENQEEVPEEQDKKEKEVSLDKKEKEVSLDKKDIEAWADKKEKEVPADKKEKEAPTDKKEKEVPADKKEKEAPADKKEKEAPADKKEKEAPTDKSKTEKKK